MCCIMGYAGHDLPKETFTEYLLRTTSRGPDDQRVAETEFGLLGFGRLAIMGLSWRPRATRSSPTPTARSSCRSTTSTALTCSGTSTPSSP